MKNKIDIEAQLKKMATEEPSEQYPTWDPQEGETLVGIVKQKRTGIPSQFGENDLMSIEDERTHDTLTLWKSKVLEPFFEKTEEGDRVGILYIGTKKGKHGNYKDYKAYNATKDKTDGE